LSIYPQQKVGFFAQTRLNGLSIATVFARYTGNSQEKSSVKGEEIRMIQNRLNNRHRKLLVFKTFKVVLQQPLTRVAL